MAAAATTGRQRYRLLVLLAAAAILLAWFFVPVDQDDPQPSGGGGTTSDWTSAPSDGPSRTRTPVRQDTDPASGLPLVDLADLPPEAAETVDLIDAGGPFPEPDHDGGTFHNREALLPDRPSGYYREYTVPTPGSDDRGARRIVAGEGGELYWTDDHYSSFSRIAGEP
ncbi:ribonuclease domain-containing protein [Nocardioides xinjiangensis]|uniref:ribonuclease domain-containing protein n=1 Tax=Nocardioides xinjiangensis TaxID=2817376 RepID=UPI001B30DF75|nr:ribonuclease domain-containing protein [Nocardioides sp. SYSU D00514]